ncbi:MAG: hypothetical protein J6113_06880 [Lachnospiraceae bacterium]|nr:hypothetical protein [Lachnospiraceae bacterium]
MKRWQKNLIRIFAIAMLVGILVLIVVSSDRLGGGALISPTPTETPTPTVTPTSTPKPTPTLPPDQTPTPTPRPTSTPTPTEPIYPYTSIENINYTDYATGMSKVYTESGVLKFGDHGYYTFTDLHGAEHTYRIADYLELQDEPDLSGGSWFFMGALSTPNYVYAQYDYWGTNRYTFFVRMSRMGRNGRLLVYMPYDEFENYRCFTASNEYIFYVRNGIQGYEIVQADLNGENVSVLVTFKDNERPSGLWLKEYELVYRIKKDNDYYVQAINLNNRQIKAMKGISTANDYIYTYERYIYTGTADNKLYFYDIDKGQERTVTLGNEAGIYYGEPVYFEGRIYLQYYKWNTGKTLCYVINPLSGRVEKSIELLDKLTYICGSGEKGLWAEQNGDYTELPLK